ncbi:AraC family transcriptional regulator [Paraburkholderia caballeronis]|uniref:AraC family transcriptional regulator n=1 Tax=Paraburkholderia caballeronis TaxID=416943 RepID=UPI0010666E0E|nr:AraC family transcriptional regulator [Paraburkholderia caballeronis]TDV39419.1 AraC family transcriptional regulator [Paraburkholderia caballeronis]
MADPFSDFLSLMRARSVVSGELIAGGAWAIDFPPTGTIKFWGVMRGRASLLFDGDDAPTGIEAGDTFLLRAPRAHVLGSDLAAPRAGLADLLDRSAGAVIRHGDITHDDDTFRMIGGKVELGAEGNRMLLDALPPLIHVRGTSRQAAPLRWLLEQLVRERESALPGSDAASAQLAHLMFIQILRAHFDTSDAWPAGWLRAIGDRRLGPALRLMHGEPARAWQLGELASACAMSRATFAAYFKSVAGVAPLAYLAGWRMRIAQRALRDERTPVNVLARSLGYGSESTFSNAFKRIVGCAPSAFRAQASVETLREADDAYAPIERSG